MSWAKSIRTVAMTVSLSLALGAHAKSSAGIEFPERVSVAGQSLVLNGVAVQKKFIFRVYSIGLYLAQPVRDAQSALAEDGVRRLRIHFLHDATRAQLVGSLEHGVAVNAPGGVSPSIKERLHELMSHVTGLSAGDELLITYVPGTGTLFEQPGQGAVTVKGKDFADALFGIWLGPDPKMQSLRQDLLSP